MTKAAQLGNYASKRLSAKNKLTEKNFIATCNHPNASCHKIMEIAQVYPIIGFKGETL
jgi:hypothetical protein